MMDRELLLEIGCEELPASWLPGLTIQIGDVFSAALRDQRLPPESAAETFSTPRRLTVCIGKVPERQTDFEELITGPPVSAAFKPDGTPTPAATGFAAKQGVDVAGLERTQTPKGEYLAFRKKLRGKTTVDVLPDVLTATLRGLTFPKLMRWDAQLDDGKGDLLFGRPIRWILYTYGGRVVPFSIARTALAQSSQVQDVTSGAVTYGHRFLTTSGRAGRAIKVRSFEEYRARLLENFVILARSERHDKIAGALDAKAQRLQGRVSRTVRAESDLLSEVPDLVEYPSVVAGTFSPEFLELPEEVLTTTLIHHQHYFPVEGEDGKLKNAFLAVINTEPDNERTIARNAERVVTARLRDARFFWDADRKVPLASRVERLSTLQFHKKLGTYKDKAGRIEKLAAWIAKVALGADEQAAKHAATAARLAKADLATDMVREFTELQGVMGGVYARHEGQPEEVWKAIYYHYLPVGVEEDAPPSRPQLGKAAISWAAVSLADKLDTIVGLFSAGEKPTGSRDPYGLRRATQGVFKIMADLPALTGRSMRPSFPALKDLTEILGHAPSGSWPDHQLEAYYSFMPERLAFVLQSRGFDVRNVRAVTSGRHLTEVRPADELQKLKILPEFAETSDFQALAIAFKRAKNIVARELSPALRVYTVSDDLLARLTEPAEVALRAEIERRSPVIEHAVRDGSGFREAFAEAAKFKPAVDRLFDEVLIISPDQQVRQARLLLLWRFVSLILGLADISEIVSEDLGA